MKDGTTQQQFRLIKGVINITHVYIVGKKCNISFLALCFTLTGASADATEGEIG